MDKTLTAHWTLKCIRQPGKLDVKTLLLQHRLVF